MTSIIVVATARMAIGTLTKNTARQPMNVVSTPPATTPVTNPAPSTAPHAPSARLRAGSSLKVVVSRDSAEGAIAAAATPCPPRATGALPPSGATCH
jgi:hypothetical protein